MKLNTLLTLNVGLGDSPEKVKAHLESFRKAGINIGGTVRGAASDAGKSNAREDRGPWETAWCALKKVSRVRRTNGRNFEQAAYHNFMTQAPDDKPKGLRAPKD